MAISLASQFKIADNVHARMFDDELVILDLNGGNYYGLDEIGARVWNALEKGHALGAVAGEIEADYEVTRAQLEADLLALARDLCDKGLMALSHG